MKIRKLASISTIVREGVAPESIRAGELYVGLEHITSEGEFEGVGSVDAGELASTKFRFGPEHILYGKLRPYLRKVAQPTFSGICSTEIVPILPHVGTDSRYLLHFLRWQHTVDWATSRCAGANLPRLNPSMLEQLEVPFPEHSHQLRVGEQLDLADGIRRKRREALRLADELVRSTFLEMFGDPVGNPRGWPSVSLDEVAQVRGGLSITPARASNPLEVPYLRVANAHRGMLDLNEIKTIRVSQAELDRSLLKPGDILVVEGHGNRDELGRCVQWRAEIPQCTHQNHLIRITNLKAELESSYLEWYLNSPEGRRQMLSFAKTTSGLNTLNTSNIAKVSVLVPPLSLQKRFVAMREQVAAVQSRQKLAIESSETFFTSLQNQAFGPTP